MKIFSVAAALVATMLSLNAEKPAQPGSLPTDPNVVTGQLDNGLEWAIMPNNEPPGRVSLRLLVRAGSLQETEAQRGLAHFLEHMAFNGSENYPPGELIEFLQRLGMSFGADTNAHTSFDETVYKLELPENSAEMIDEGLQVLRDYAGGLLLREEEIEKERGVILSEKRDRDSVGYRTFVAYWEFLFPEARMPERFPIGIEEVIENADRDEFVDFYKTWYRSDNMAVVIVGDVDPKTAAKDIEKMFGDLPVVDKDLPTIDLGTIAKPELATRLHSEPEAPATEVALMTLKEHHGLPDSKVVRMRDIMTSAANRMVSRRLEKLSKAEEAPFKTGSAYFFDYLNFFELGGIEVNCQPDQWEEALTVIEQELRRAIEHGFTDAEVAEVKAKMLNEYEKAVKAAPTRKSRDLSAGIVDSMSNKLVFTAPEADLEIAREALSTLSPVTAQRSLSNLWKDGGRFVFVSGNLELDNPDAALSGVYKKSAGVAVEPPTAEAELEWPYSNFGEAGVVVSETEAPDIGVKQAVFANNVHLNFKQTDFEANSIQVYVRFGGGNLQMDPSQKGLATFANLAFTAGGLEALSIDELERVLAGQSVGVGFSVAEDHFALSGGTTPKDFRRQLELVAAYLTAPGYREEAARLAAKSYEEMAIKVEKTVEGVWGYRVASYLAGDNFRFGFPTEEEFSAQDMSKLKGWLKQPLTSDFLEISIVGEIDYETAKTVVADTLGALPKRADKADLFKAERKGVEFPTTTEEQLFTFESDIPRAMAAVLWPTTDFWDIERTRRLNVLASIFRDRLRLEVREKLGEGYSPYARNESSDTFDGYGYMFGLNFADPAKVESVAEIIRNLGIGVGEGNITQDELDRAVLPIQKFVEEYVRKNSYWLGRVLSGSSTFPQQLDWARTLATDYGTVSLDEVNALATEYLGSGPGLPVIIKPASSAVDVSKVE
ncbi:MAG: insulinase family protein [Verrucomicrobiota bacterium]